MNLNSSKSTLRKVTYALIEDRNHGQIVKGCQTSHVCFRRMAQDINKLQLRY